MVGLSQRAARSPDTNLRVPFPTSTGRASSTSNFIGYADLAAQIVERVALPPRLPFPCDAASSHEGVPGPLLSYRRVTRPAGDDSSSCDYALALRPPGKLSINRPGATKTLRFLLEQIYSFLLLERFLLRDYPSVPRFFLCHVCDFLQEDCQATFVFSPRVGNPV